MTGPLRAPMWPLLPAHVQARDLEEGGPLWSFLGILESQADLLRESIRGFWDDLFVETASPWVLPYIGDLVGNNPIHGTGAGRRADLANTIHYRRRKGTLPMLESMANDVTGWPVRAVAFFEHVGWTQNLNHLRLAPHRDPTGRDPPASPRVGTALIRQIDGVDRIEGPFDSTSHTVDIRPGGLPEGAAPPRPVGAEGRHNIMNVGFFLQRVQSFQVPRATPRRRLGKRHLYRVSPLGNDMPLYTLPPPRIPDALGTELHFGGPIRRVAFHGDKAAYMEQGQPDETQKSIAIHVGDQPLTADQVVCRDLRGWSLPAPLKWPAGAVAAIDVRRGRIAFKKKPGGEVRVTHCYGLTDAIGAGPHDRQRQPADAQDTVANPLLHGDTALLRVGKGQAHATLAAAFGAIGPGTRVIQIEDSRTYAIPAGPLGMAAGAPLTLQAANGQRPTLTGTLTAGGGGAGSRLRLDGLLVAGGVRIEAPLDALEVAHCTLVPGRGLTWDGRPRTADASLEVADTALRIQVAIERSVVGRLQVPAVADGLSIRDSIVDAGPLLIDGQKRRVSVSASAGPGPELLAGPCATIERSTLMGECRFVELALASDTLFAAPVTVDRRQSGCVRFSHVPEGSTVPRRHRCQPDMALAERAADTPPQAVRNRLTPEFASERYGDPAYAQLAPATAHELRAGAGNGSEMGAWNLQNAVLREADLRLRLAEHLPFGMEPRLIPVTHTHEVKLKEVWS